MKEAKKSTPTAQANTSELSFQTRRTESQLLNVTFPDIVTQMPLWLFSICILATIVSAYALFASMVRRRWERDAHNRQLAQLLIGAARDRSRIGSVYNFVVSRNWARGEQKDHLIHSAYLAAKLGSPADANAAKVIAVGMLSELKD